MNNTAIIQGSLGAISKQDNKSLAETFLNADIIVIVDTSGSMHAEDSRGGQSRYQVACDELALLQANKPGKIAVIAFSHDVMFCPSGVPFDFGGGTALAGALHFTKVADVTGMQFIVISDGVPNSPDQALEVARTYKNKINTIFVGPEDDNEGGRAFLACLASASGGQAITADRVKQLAASVEKLLLKA